MDSDSSNENEPRRSRRLSTIIPASHWMSIGYIPREAEAMETLMKDMNRYCEGGVDDDVELSPRLRFGLDLVIPYHDMMLPLWKKFSEALLISTAEKDVEELEIERISMPPLSIVRSLSNAIANHQHLKTVTLQRCGMSNTSLLRTFLAGCSRMKYIDLEDNEITSQGAIAIADCISTNPDRLQAFFLNNNNISDGDMIVLSSALKLNTHLLLIELRDNDVTEQGWKVLHKARFDAANMNSLIDCNHTCVVAVDDEVMKDSNMPLQVAEVIMINGNMDSDGEVFPTQTPIKEKIRKKVVLALCGVEGELFDLSLLNDVPLQLMPRVLELIQEHTTSRQLYCEDEDDDEQLEKDALSRLFHILRAWELPLLFDNLHYLPTRRSKRKRGVSSR